MDGTEIEIIRSMRRGEEDAFAWLFHKYQAKAFRAAWLITGNTADSEDIVQETFLKCYMERGRLKEERAFESWLFQILTRTAWRHMKKNRREQPSDQVLKMGEKTVQGNPLDEALERELREDLLDAVRELDVKQRTVIVLYYFNQFSTKEISRIMGCMEGTVKSRLYTARKNLKERLERSGQEGRYEERTV